MVFMSYFIKMNRTKKQSTKKRTVNVFKLEEYLAQHEFSAPYLLCCSDAEGVSMQDVIDRVNSEEQKLWSNLTLGYTEVLGLPLLRAQIANTLYPGLKEDNILCFAGAADGIFCALHTLCRTGDHVIVLTPCYQSLKEIPELTGASVTAIALREENDWRIDCDAVKESIQPNTKVVVINFPHNPTGQVITSAELNDLVTLCDRSGIWIFSDEVYHSLGHPADGWAAPAAQIYPRALSLNVMSKSFRMAGLRVGWIACQDKTILKKIEHMKHYTSICNSAPAEVISLIALRNKDIFLERNNQIVADNLKTLDEFMDVHQDLFSWVRPQGGCVGFVHYKSQESVDNFAARLIQKKEVLIMPASIYDYDRNYFRIGFGRKNMPVALNRLKELVQS